MHGYLIEYFMSNLFELDVLIIIINVQIISIYRNELSLESILLMSWLRWKMLEPRDRLKIF